MARESRYFYAEDPIVETRYDDTKYQDARYQAANDREFDGYPDPPPLAMRGGEHPDDNVPLFLSNDIDLPAEQIWKTGRRKPITVPIVTTVVLAVAAMAFVLVLFSMQDTRAVAVNAKASLASALPAEAAAPSPAPQVQTTGIGRSSPATSPSRQEIAAAFQTALQGQPEVRQPPVRQATAFAPPARRLDTDELAALLKRAKGLIAAGDIASARLLLERAADAHEAQAALILAQTYDPAVLGTADARRIIPDPATARLWYRRAAEFGSSDAQARLNQMPD
jgi:hypothetical protein